MGNSGLVYSCVPSAGCEVALATIFGPTCSEFYLYEVGLGGALWFWKGGEYSRRIINRPLKSI